MKPRGRPKKPKSQAKIESLEIRVGTLEKQTFKEAAALAGIPLSAWVRERLRRAAIRDLEDVGQPIPFLQAISGR